MEEDMINLNPRINSPCLNGVLFCVGMLLAPLASAQEPAVEAEAPRTFDNLVAVAESPVAMAYIDPDVDFSVFTRVAILEPYVAFRSNWQRDQRRRRSSNVSARDMERIKQDVATTFQRVFTERLEAAGYEVVDVAGDDVLLLRPAIIDLDVTAPDTRPAGRSRTYSASTGAATLYIQLFDSYTGEIVGRAADRRAARSPGGMISWTNSVTNLADARRLMGGWADTLVAFLDSHYK
jgi:hypothetical protein